MTLILSVLRCPDAVSPETRRVTGGDFTLGRSSDADWPLADPERILSKRHCTLEFRGGFWLARDTSSNGTFLNRDATPIGQGEVRDLRDGDRLRLGGYEIEVRIEEDASVWAPPPQPASGPPSGSTERFDDSLFGGPPRTRDPFGEPPASLSGRDDISIGLGGPSGGALLPDDFDLGFDPPGAGPTQPDHAAAGEQSFFAPLPAAAKLPDDDDWLTPMAAPPAASPAAPPPREPAVSPPLPAADASSDLLDAFLRGAAIEGARPADPAAAMAQLGAAFRALVVGLRQALIARAAIKGEFRIEQTMVRARGNNPLKFSAGDEDALMALLGAGRRTDMTPAQAVADALRDMRLHELAAMTAMQQAVRAILTRLDPARLRSEADKAGGLLPAQRRARAFDAYEKLHADVAAALADDFDSVFGKAFARAYEQALAEAADKERS